MARRAARLAGYVLCGVLAAGAIALALSHRASIAAIPRPDPASFAKDLVERGAALARIGNCAVCHTQAGGALYAGGRALATPFGTIYGTNITPDEASGIGSWPKDAFARALREGVARDGTHLYPAFPYEHFNALADADIDALYAFLMTRPAVAQQAPANRLIPPLGFRPLLAGWKLLFLHRDAAPADRGAYLVQVLAHCGACHTPRNGLGAERRDRPFAGGWSEGWYAPPLDGSNPSHRAWSEDRIAGYLRTGFDSNHAAAAGPMGPVARSLSGAPDADIRAIAAYVAKWIRQAPDAPALDRREAAAQIQPAGATLFAGACAACHENGAPMMLQGRPPLSFGTPLHETTPRDAILIVLQGLAPPLGDSGPAMPAFGDTFDDRQLADLTAYLRARFSTQPAWSSLEREVAAARKEGNAP
ncbi:MAG: cytochrome c, class [Rhodospirillales bacterium]|nr:cytochrome c, class [Rhodospirillales bacterium]